MQARRGIALVAVLGAVIMLTGCGGAGQGAVRIGVLASCDGFWGYWYDGALAATELPLLERGARLAGSQPRDGVQGATVGSKPVQLSFGCGDGLSERALAEARRLVEKEHVAVLVGPTTLAEAFAIRTYAQRHPEVTFVLGSASGQAVTLQDPPTNLFRFTPAGTQWMAGLGSYAYRDLGWRRVVTLGDDWSFSYLLTAGFAAEFCALGGSIVNAVWLPPGGDVESIAAAVPRRGVDGFLQAGYPDVRIIERIPQLRGRLAGRLVASSVFGTEPAVLEALGKRLDGVVYADPTGAGRSSDRYVSGMERFFPRIGEHVRSTSPPHYYTAMEAVAQALEAVGADLSSGQRAFRAALSSESVDGAGGRVTLDVHRQANSTNFLMRLRSGRSGVTARVFRTIPNVEQTFNGYFRPDQPLTGRNTVCRKSDPPPWALR